MKNPYRIGRSIYLRPVEREDAALLQQWINDPEVTRFLSRYMPVNRESEVSWIDGLGKSTTDVALAIVRIEDDRLIGITGLHGIDAKDHRAVFGIAIGDKQAWDKGYGTEATGMMTRLGFETFNLHRIELQVYDMNPRGIRVYEKIGYVKEGVFRERHYHDGRYHDVVNMAILRREWEARREG